MTPQAISNTSSMGAHKERMAHFDTMRAIAIVMVVAGHALGYCRTLPKTTYAVIFFIVNICVAVFFLADGFLFANTMRSKRVVAYGDYVKKSATRLLIPWLIFMVGYTIMRYIFELYGFFDNHIVVGKPFIMIARYSYGGVIAPHLYFISALFLIRILAPVTGRLVTMNRYAILIACILYASFYRLPVGNYVAPYLKIEGGYDPILHAFMGFQFYLVGIVLYLFKDSINNAIAFYSFALLLLLSFLISVPVAVTGIKSIVQQYLYLLSFYFGMSSFFKNKSLLKQLGANTMGIYLLHAPVVIKAVSLLINRLVAIPLLTFALITLVVFSISYALTTVINRIPYGSLLFGVPYRRAGFAQPVIKTAQ